MSRSFTSGTYGLYFQKPAALGQTKVRRLPLPRPWCGAKLFSSSKTVFINMKVAVDFCVRTLYDQICVYARFINEAPEHFVIFLLITNSQNKHLICWYQV